MGFPRDAAICADVGSSSHERVMTAASTSARAAQRTVASVFSSFPVVIAAASTATTILCLSDVPVLVARRIPAQQVSAFDSPGKARAGAVQAGTRAWSRLRSTSHHARQRAASPTMSGVGVAEDTG